MEQPRAVRVVRNWFRRPQPLAPAAPLLSESEQAAERWKIRNERARLTGCQCGAPATRVRCYGPCEVWTCDEHVGVNRWDGRPDENGILIYKPVWPTPREANALAKWETRTARPYSDVERLRGGTA